MKKVESEATLFQNILGFIVLVGVCCCFMFIDMEQLEADFLINNKVTDWKSIAIFLLPFYKFFSSMVKILNKLIQGSFH